MSLKTIVVIFVGVLFLSIAGCRNASFKKEIQEPYQENWESLSKHNEAPEWFKDAKLGIYFHWGVYSVPAYGDEWYLRWMHFKSWKEYQHHVDTYGDPSVFGYHDFVPMFKAEYFYAEVWATIRNLNGI